MASASRRLSTTCSAYSSAAARSASSAACLRAAARLAAPVSPSSSASSSSSGTSATVQAAGSAGLARVARSPEFRSRRSGSVYKRASACSGVSSGHSASSAWLMAGSVASSARRSRSSPGVRLRRPSCPAACRVSSSSMTAMNVARALLCGSGAPVSGSRLLHARSRASRHVLGVSRYVIPSTLIAVVLSGTCSRSATACVRTPAILARPLTRAACGVSGARASTPGYSEPIVESTTSFSPSDGRTWSMYRMNVPFGPMTRMPRRSSCLRYV